jgi:hypothetical protein
MRIHGKNGQVLMDETGGSPYTPTALGDMDAFTLDMTTDRAEVTAFGDTNKQRVMGLPDFSGTLGFLWNSQSSPRFFGVVLGGEPAFLRLVPNRLESAFNFQGLANIDGSINVNAKGEVRGTGKWDAAGNWEMNAA